MICARIVPRGSWSAALLLLGLAASAASAATLPSGFTETQIPGFSSPTLLDIAPDGRVFVSQQNGQLRIIKNGALLSTPFVTLTVDPNGERGLLGITFDPSFATNNFLYVYYTATTPAVHNRVSRLTANGDVMLAGSEVPLLDLPNLSSATNHNGGSIHFGGDGKLYVSVGENANPANAQSTSTTLGKMLRINSDGTIPADNPFFGSTTGQNRAIWALGLRNPFTFSVQRTTGRIFINDVSQSPPDGREEINDGLAGTNYNWPNTQGPGSFYNYANTGADCAITGGDFYNPTTANFPASYVDQYFFNDYCGGWIRTLNLSTHAVANFATGISSPTGTRVAPDGSLYYIARGQNAVYRVRATTTTAPNVSVQPQNQSVAPGQTASFSITATGSAPLAYQWQRNGTNVSGANAATYSFMAVAADNGAQFRCIVSNGVLPNATSNPATLTVSANAAPVPSLSLPVAGTMFSGNDVINYAATATDFEDGTLAAAAFSWTIVFHHDTHTHPFLGPINGVRSGSFTIPNRGETASNVWYRIHLIVTDSQGLATEITRDILPRKANITVTTNPPGQAIAIDGVPTTAPSTFTGVVGMIQQLGTTSPQAGNDFVYWSDFGAMTHEITIPATTTTYTATFAPPSPPASFYTLAPCRLLDTRLPNGTYGGPMMATGVARVFPLANQCGIPATARALSVNITVTQPSSAGFFRLYPAGGAVPLASNINYVFGQTRANNATVGLNAAGELAVRCDQGTGTTAHVILDVNGYYQ